MSTPHDSSLGREVAYPTGYDPTLLFPIPRAGARAELGLAADAPLPFEGHDRWHAYELGWLDGRGKPRTATATLLVPAASPNLVESKSLKLYLNSLNGARFADDDALRACIETARWRAAWVIKTIVRCAAGRNAGHLWRPRRAQPYAVGAMPLAWHWPLDGRCARGIS